MPLKLAQKYKENKSMKALKYIGLVFVLALFAMTFMGIYTQTATYPKYTEWSGGIWKFTGTFVAATDTFYFPFSIPRPKTGTDTIAVIADCGVAPYKQTGTTDTVKVVWSYQWSDDNTNWQTATAIGTDSTKTGTEGVYTWKQKTISIYTDGGLHPYYRIIAIGAATTGGATNVIGNKLLVYLLRQYGY
jgi:hypothetical protein